MHAIITKGSVKVSDVHDIAVAVSAVRELEVTSFAGRMCNFGTARASWTQISDSVKAECSHNIHPVAFER